MNFNSKTTLAAALAVPVMALADMAAAEMINADSAVIGKATFEQTPHGVADSLSELVAERVRAARHSYPFTFLRPQSQA